MVLDVVAAGRLVHAQRDKRQYIPCPDYLGLPLSTELNVGSIIAERRRWRAAMAEAERCSAEYDRRDAAKQAWHPAHPAPIQLSFFHDGALFELYGHPTPEAREGEASPRSAYRSRAPRGLVDSLSP